MSVVFGACGSGTVTMNMKSLSTATAFNEYTGKIETYQSVLAREVEEYERQFGPMAANDYGEALVTTSATTGLSSFKMYFRQIKLCEDLTISGSGYSGEKNCQKVYENTSDSYAANYDDQVATSFNRAAAVAAGSGKYYDLLDSSASSSTGVKALTKSATIPAGTYNYGIVEAHHWIKLTGTVPSPMSTPVCTQSGGSESYATGGDGVKTYYTSVSSMTSCSAPGEATVWVNSSNTQFKFLAPFKVNAGDKVELDMVFNLNNTVRGGISGTALNSNFKTGSSNPGMLVPMLRVVPVPRKSGEVTKGEIYTITPSSSSKWKLRAELYYNGSDTNKTILAALITPIQASVGASDIDLSSAAFYAYDVSQSGSTVTFKSYDGSTTLVLDRSGTSATITCPKSSSGSYMLSTDCNAATVTGTYSTPTTVTFSN
jgi:hypothetical protein